MIEPVNFFGALRRRWRLVAVLMVVGAIVALVAPISVSKHHKTVLKFETYALVGAPSSSGALQGGVTNAQILFYANTFPVKLAAISVTRLKGNKYVYTNGMFATTVPPSTKTGYPPPGGAGATTTPSKKSLNSGTVTLWVAGPTKKLAALLCYNYAAQLGKTLTEKVAAHAASSAKKGSQADTSVTTASTGYQVLVPGLEQTARRVNRPKASALDSHKVRLGIGLILGAALALAIILAREVLDKTVRRSDRASHHFKFPVVAVIPETYPPDPGVVDVVHRPTSPASEAYRKLRMSVLFESLAAYTAPGASDEDGFADLFGIGAPKGEPYKVPDAGSRNVILVGSTADEPSRAKVVANLAAAYAEAGEHVIVIGTADIETGAAYGAESFQSGPATAADIRRWMVPAGPDNVSALSMGHFVRNSGQLVSRAKAVFDAAREVASAVIVETPAFLRFHHGEALSHSVDVVLVVAENGVTRVSDAREMGESLRRLGAPVLGVVYTGEALSKEQRKALEAAVPAPVPGTRQDPAGGAGAAVRDDAGPGDGADLGAPELHPS